MPRNTGITLPGGAAPSIRRSMHEIRFIKLTRIGCILCGVLKMSNAVDAFFNEVSVCAASAIEASYFSFLTLGGNPPATAGILLLFRQLMKSLRIICLSATAEPNSDRIL